MRHPKLPPMARPTRRTACKVCPANRHVDDRSHRGLSLHQEMTCMIQIPKRKRVTIPATACPRFGLSSLLAVTAAVVAGTIGPAPGPRPRRRPPILKILDDFGPWSVIGAAAGNSVGQIGGRIIGEGMSVAVQGARQAETGQPIDVGTVESWGEVGSAIGSFVGTIVGAIGGAIADAWHKLREELPDQPSGPGG